MSGNFRALYRNYIMDATLSVPAGAMANFPAVMLQDLDRTKLVRQAGQELVIQGTWDSQRDCAAMVIGQHNLGVNGSIRLQTNGGHDQTWEAWEPIYQFGREVLGTGYVGGYPSREDVEALTAGPLRYIYFGTAWWFSSFTLTLSDPDNADGWIEAGLLFLGPYLEAEVNYVWPYRLGHVDYSQRQRLPDGKLAVRKGRQANRLELEFQHVSRDSHFGEFHRWLRMTGGHTPFFIDPSPNGGGDERWWQRMYCHREDTNLPETEFVNRGNYSLALEEAL